jgi:hypothetical protein
MACMVVTVRAVGGTAGSLMLVAAVVVGAARLWVAAAVMMVVVTHWVEGTRAIACRTQDSRRHVGSKIESGYAPC